MAVRSARKPAAKKTVAAKKTTKPVEPVAEEDFDEELLEEENGEDLEEDDFDEVEEDEPVPAPKKTRSTRAQQVAFGVSDICDILSKKTGKDVTTRELRQLIRRMARDGSGRVDREVIPGNRARYEWSGPNDPEVKAIVKAYVGGEAEVEKQEKLLALKERNAAKAAAPAKKTAAKKTATKKKAAPVVEDDEDEELDFDEDE